jgi:hypothetical protein
MTLAREGAQRFDMALDGRAVDACDFFVTWQRCRNSRGEAMSTIL